MPPEVEQRFQQIEGVLAAFAASFEQSKQRFEQIDQRLDRTSEELDRLAELTSALIETIDLQSTQAEIDRREFRAGINDILAYLRERFNGHGN